jgi:HlyD family secretion protein
MTEPQKKKGPPKPVLILIVLAVVGGVAYKLYVSSQFRYAGTLEATKVDISSQVPSGVSTVDVREGDHVKQDQKLVSLACEDIRVASQLANENYDRTLRLYHSGTASQESLDQMKNHKDDADVRMGWCDIKSPIQGTVLSRYHEPGEWVNPGTKLLTLANIRDIWAYIYIPQPDVARLKPGMKLTGHLPEMNDKTFEGTILKVNEEAEFTPKNVQTRSERQRLVFGVKVSFLGVNDDEILKPGMTIEIDLPKE